MYHFPRANYVREVYSHYSEKPRIPASRLWTHHSPKQRMLLASVARIVSAHHMRSGLIPVILSSGGLTVAGYLPHSGRVSRRAAAQ